MSSVFASTLLEADKVTIVTKVVFQAPNLPQETISDYTFDTEQTIDIYNQKATTGRAIFNPLTIVKSITENSPKYFVDECRGTALPNVTVSIYSQINGKDILRYKYTFKLVYIKTITDTLDTDKNSPSYGQYVEKISFVYGSVVIDFYNKNATVGVIGGWDSVQNTTN